MVCENCRGSESALLRLGDELHRKERELQDLSSKFSKQKLQSKAKVTQLRQQLNEISETHIDSNGGNEENLQIKLSRLVLRLDEVETELSRSRDEVEAYKANLVSKETQVSDHLIKIKSLEDQLELADDYRKSTETLIQERNTSDSQRTDDAEETKAKKVKSGQSGREIEASVYAQLVYKDTKILELNNTILAKDRQVLDLQELCRERQEVVDAKSKAIQILQRQIQQLSPPPHRDASTEVDIHDPIVHPEEVGIEYSEDIIMSTSKSSGSSASPGHAIAVIGLPRTGSPPPADPALEDQSSITTDSVPDLLDVGTGENIGEAKSSRNLNSRISGLHVHLESMQETERGLAASSSTSSILVVDSVQSFDGATTKKRNKKKRVTFDFSEQERERELKELREQLSQSEESCSDLREENEELRGAIGDVEGVLEDAKTREAEWELQFKLVQAHADQLKQNIEENKREGKNNVLKAKAQIQSRVKELEDELGDFKSAKVEQELEMKDLQRQLELANETNRILKDQLKDELDTSQDLILSLEDENSILREKVDDMLSVNQSLENQRTSFLSNIEPLKETVDTSNELIESLESEIKSLKDDVSQRDGQIEELSISLEEARATADALLQQKKDLFADVDSLKEAVEASQQVIESLETDLQIAEVESEELRHRLSEMRVETGEVAAELAKESTEKKLKGKAFQTKLRILEQDKEELARESTGYKLKWKAFDTKIRILTKENEQLEQKLDERLEALKSLEEQVKGLIQEVDKTSSENRVLEEKLEKAKTKQEFEHVRLKEAKKNSHHLLEEKGDIENELKKHWEKESELKRLLGETEGTCDRLREERSKWIQHCKDLETTEGNLTSQLSAITESKQEMEQKCLQLKDQISVLESGATEATKGLAQELANLRGHFQNVDTTNQRLITENEKLSKVETELTQERNSLRSQLDNLSTQMETLEATHAVEITRLQTDLDSWRVGCDQQQAAVEDMQNELSSLRASSRQLVEVKEKLQRELEILTEQLNSTDSTFQQELTTITMEKESLETQYRSCISKFQSVLDESIPTEGDLCHSEMDHVAESVLNVLELRAEEMCSLRTEIDNLEQARGSVHNTLSAICSTLNSAGLLENFQTADVGDAVSNLCQKVLDLEDALATQHIKQEAAFADEKAVLHHRFQTMQDSLVNVQLKSAEAQEFLEKEVESRISLLLERQTLNEKEIRQELENLTIIKDKAEFQLVVTSEKLQLAESTIVCLQQEISEKECIIIELNNTVESLTSQDEELQSTLVLKDTQITKLHIEMSEIRSRAQVKLVESEDICDQSGNELEDTVKQLECLQSEVAHAHSERERLSQDRQNLCHEILALNANLEEAKGKLESQDIVIEGLNESIAALIRENEEAIEVHQRKEGTNADDLEDLIAAERREWTGKVTSLEEENQLLRHCLNQAESSADERGNRVEELEVLDTAQKTVISKLREQTTLMDTTLSTLKEHKNATIVDINAQKGQLQSDFTRMNVKLEEMIVEAKTKDIELEQLKQQRIHLEGAYQSVTQYYSDLQAAYTTMYQQLQQLPAAGDEVVETPKTVQVQHTDAETMTDNPEESDTQIGPDRDRKEVIKLKARIKRLQLELKESKYGQAGTDFTTQVDTPVKDKTSSPVALVSLSKSTETEVADASPTNQETVSELQTKNKTLSESVAEIGELHRKQLENKDGQLEGLSQHLHAIQVHYEEEHKLYTSLKDNLKDALRELDSIKTEKDSVLQNLLSHKDTTDAYIANLDGEVKGYIQHVMQLGEKLQATSIDGQEDKKQVGKLTDHIKRLKEEHENLREMYQLQTEEITSLKQMWYQLEAERSSFEQQNQGLKQQVDTLQDQHEQKMKEQSKTHELDIENLKLDLAKISLELETFSADKVELTSQIALLHLQLDEKETVIRELPLESSSEQQDIATELSTVQQKYAEMVEKSKDLESHKLLLEEELEFLKQINESSDQDKQTMMDSYGDLEDLRIQLEQASELKDSQYAELEKKFNLVQKLLDKADSDAKAIAQKYENLLAEYNDGLLSRDALQETIAKGEEAQKDMEALETLHSLTVEELSNLKETNKQLEERLAAQENQLSSLEKDDEELKEKLKLAEASRTVMEDAIEPLERRLMEIEERNVELEDANQKFSSRIKKLTTDNSELRAQLSPLQDMMAVKDVLMEKLGNLETTCDQIHEERHELVEKIQSVETQLECSELEKDKIRHDLASELDKNSNSVEEMQQKLNDLESALVTAKSEKEAVEQELQNLKTKFEEAEKHNQTLSSELESTISQGMECHSRMHTTEQTLESVQNTLEHVLSEIEEEKGKNRKLIDGLKSQFSLDCELDSEHFIRAICDKVMGTVQNSIQNIDESLTALVAELVPQEKKDQIEKKLKETFEPNDELDVAGGLILVLQQKVTKMESIVTTSTAELRNHLDSVNKEYMDLKADLEKTKNESSWNQNRLSDVQSLLSSLFQAEPSVIEEKTAEEITQLVVNSYIAFAGRESQFQEVQKQWSEAVAERDNVLAEKLAENVALTEQLSSVNTSLDEMKKQNLNMAEERKALEELQQFHESETNRLRNHLSMVLQFFDMEMDLLEESAIDGLKERLIRISKAEEQKQAYQDEIYETKNHLEMNTLAVQRLEVINGEYRQTVLELETKLTELECALHKQFEEDKAQLVLLHESAAQQLDAEKIELHDVIEELKNQVKHLDDRNGTAIQEARVAQENENALQGKYESLLSDFQTMKESLSYVESTNNDLKKKLETSLASLESAEAKKSSLVEQIYALSQKLEVAEAANIRLGDEILDLQTEKSRTCAEAEQQVQIIEKELVSLKLVQQETFQKSESSVHVQESKTHELEAEIEALRRKQEDQEQRKIEEIAVLEVSWNSERTHFEECLKKNTEKILALQTELDVANTERSSQQSEMQLKAEELEIISAEVNSKQKLIEDLQQKLRDSKENLEYLEYEKIEAINGAQEEWNLEKANYELERSTQLSEMQLKAEELEIISAEVNSKQKLIEELQQKLRDSKENLEYLEYEKIEAINGAQEEWNLEKANYELEIQFLRDQDVNLKDSAEKMVALQVELGSMTTERNNIQAEMHVMSEEFKTVSVELVSKQNSIDELKHKFAIMKENSEYLEYEKTEAVKCAQEEWDLKQANLEQKIQLQEQLAVANEKDHAEQIQVLEAKLDQITTEHNSLQTAMHAKSEELERILSEVTAKQNVVEELKQSLKDLKENLEYEKLEAIHGAREEWDLEKTKLEQEIQRLQEQLTVIDNTEPMQTLQHDLSQITTSENLVKSEEFEKMSTELSSKQKYIELLQQKVNDLKENMEYLEYEKHEAIGSAQEKWNLEKANLDFEIQQLQEQTTEVDLKENTEKIVSLQTELHSITIQRDNLQTEVQLKKDEIERISAETSSKQELINGLQQQVADLKENVDYVEYEKTEAICAAREEWDLEKANFELKLQQIQEQISEQEQKVQQDCVTQTPDASNEELKTMEQENQELKQQLEDNLQGRHSLKTQITQLEERLYQLESDHETVISEKIKLEKEIETVLSNRSEELEQLNSEHVAITSHLQTQVSSLTEMLERSQKGNIDLSGKIEVLEAKLTNLSNEVFSKEQQIETLQNKLDIGVENIADRQTQIHQLEEECDEIRDQLIVKTQEFAIILNSEGLKDNVIADLEQKIEMLESEAKLILEEKSEAVNAANKWDQDRATLEQALTEAKLEIQKLYVQMDETVHRERATVQQSSFDTEKMLLEDQTKKEKILTLQTSKEELQKQIAENEEKLNSIQREQNIVESQVKNQDGKINLLSSEKEELGQQLEETQAAVIALQHSLHKLQKDYEITQEEKKTLKDKIIKEKNVEFQSTIQTLSQARDDSIRLVGELREQISTLERRMESQNLKLAEKEVIMDKLKEAEEMVSSNKDERDQTRISYHEAQEEVAFLRVKLEESEVERQHLKERFVVVDEELTAVTSREQIRITQMQQHLNKAKEDILRLEEEKNAVVAKMLAEAESKTQLAQQLEQWHSEESSSDPLLPSSSETHPLVQDDQGRDFCPDNFRLVLPLGTPQSPYTRNLGSTIRRLQLWVRSQSRRHGWTSWAARWTLILYLLSLHFMAFYCWFL